MSVYKLYSASVGDAAAQLDIQLAGFITAVLIALDPNALDALSDSYGAEVSFASSSGFDSNDSKSAIAQHHVSNHFLTSGGGIGSTSIAISGLKIQVFPGERIFLHTQTVGGAGESTIFLYVEDGIDQKPAPRRR